MYQRNYLFGIIILIQLLLLWCFRDAAFFWDTVQLASKQAHFFFENGFDKIILPEAIDSGHPPGFGYLLAIFWTIFGKSLLVSHLLMWPFVLANLFLAYQLGKIYLENPFRGVFFPLLLLVDPVLAGQSILVSPDIMVVFGFLLTWLGIKRNQHLTIIAGVIILAIFSMRGMMIGAALYVFALFSDWHKQDAMSTIFKKLLPFLPGGILGLLFLFYHYQQTGWIGYHTDSPWAASFGEQSLRSVPKNAIILCWRLMDYGRFGLLMISGGIISWILLKRKPGKLAFKADLLVLLGSLSFFLLPSFLMYNSLTGHRYILPVLIVLSLLFLVYLEYLNFKKYIITAGLAAAFLFTGNWWVYPDTIAQGWDATLGHTPYYSLRKEAISFLEKEQIPLGAVGTVFPAIGPLDWYDLNGQKTGFHAFNPDTTEYVFYSNIMNDFPDEVIKDFKNNWFARATFSSPTVEVVVYKKPEIWNGEN